MTTSTDLFFELPSDNLSRHKQKTQINLNWKNQIYKSLNSTNYKINDLVLYTIFSKYYESYIPPSTGFNIDRRFREIFFMDKEHNDTTLQHNEFNYRVGPIEVFAHSDQNSEFLLKGNTAIEFIDKLNNPDKERTRLRKQILKEARDMFSNFDF